MTLPWRSLSRPRYNKNSTPRETAARFSMRPATGISVSAMSIATSGEASKASSSSQLTRKPPVSRACARYYLKEKSLSSGSVKPRQKFEEDFPVFADQGMVRAGEEIPKYKLLRHFCSCRLKPAFNRVEQNNACPLANPNFQSAQFPQCWAKSPVQHFGETEKAVGLPIIRAKYRKAVESVGSDQKTADYDLCDALARRVLHSTIQPVSHVRTRCERE